MKAEKGVEETVANEIYDKILRYGFYWRLVGVSDGERLVIRAEPDARRSLCDEIRNTVSAHFNDIGTVIQESVGVESDIFEGCRIGGGAVSLEQYLEENPRSPFGQALKILDNCISTQLPIPRGVSFGLVVIEWYNKMAEYNAGSRQPAY